MPGNVVVTGLGTVNPLGNNVEESWNALLAGRSGIRQIETFDPDAFGLKTRIAGEVRNFDPDQLIGKKEARRLDRFSQMGLVAATEAVENAALTID